jgi:hypothetical protein
MSIGYSAKLLQTFYKDTTRRVASLMERAQELTRSITLDTAELLEHALDIAAHVDVSDHDRIARKTALLGLRIAASDRVWHAALDALERDMAQVARGEVPAARKTVRRTATVAQGAAVAGWLALWATGTSSCDGKKSLVVDALPRDAGAFDGKKDGPLVVDAAPTDSGARNDLPVYDPLPRDASPLADSADGTRTADTAPIEGGAGDTFDGAMEKPLVADPLPMPSDARDVPPDIRTYEVVDPLPPPGDARDLPRDNPIREIDPLPPPSDARDVGADVRDAGGNEPPFAVDPLADARVGLQVLPQEGDPGAFATREHWANTSLVRMKRSQDLPLCLCPELCLAGAWQGGKILARLTGVPDTFSVRWQAQGQVEGAGAEATWTPSSDEDQLDVVVRTHDGVAVTSLRLGQASGRKET